MAERATVATLAAILERLEKTTVDGFTHVEQKLGEFVLKELYSSEQVQLRERVGQLENAFRWITRLVISLVVAAVIGLVVGTSNGLHS